MVNYINMFDFDDAIAEAQSIIGGDEPEPDSELKAVSIDNLLKARDKTIELLETINAEIDVRRGPVYNEADELTQIIKNYFGV